MKWFLLFLTILMSVSLVDAQICEGLIQPNVECQMVTPPTISTTYLVLNESSLLVDSGDLTSFNDTIMYWNFTQPTGKYLLILPEDGITRQVQVGYEEEAMGSSWIAIIVALSFMTLIYTVLAISIKEKGLIGIKSFLFILSLAHAFTIGAISLLVSLNPTDSTTFQPVAEGILAVEGLCFMALLWMYGAYLIKRGVSSGKED